MSRQFATTPPDLLSVLLPIVREAVPEGVTVGPTKTDANKFVQLRIDLQNPVTPLSRYARVGITVWWVDEAGQARLDKAFDLSNVVARVIQTANVPEVLHAEWQSGPADTLDKHDTPIQYTTMLLEVTNNL